MKINYEKILKLFVADGELGRFVLQKPFYSDDVAAGTNGHIACMVDRKLVKLSPNPPDKKFPTVKSVLPIEYPEPIEIQVKHLHSRECEKTMGKKVECDRCHGDGECICDCGDEHECVKCDGEGMVGPPHPIALLNGKGFRYEYIDTVRRAAGLVGADTVRYFDCGTDAVSVFEFDKLRCVIMPLRSDSVNAERYLELLPQKEAMTEVSTANVQ